MGDYNGVGFDPVIELDGVRVFHGDCVEVLRSLPDNSVDSVVTDPPYGLEFMGKDWDAPWKKSEVVKVTDKSTNGVFHDKGFKHGIRYNRGRQEMLTFQAWSTEWAVECLRVLKPGGHLLAFGGTRTWHRLAVAVEDAGFEIRDNIAWMYGSGFPKSLDVSKAIDNAAGAEREREELIGGALNSGTANGWNGSNPHSKTAKLAGTKQINNPITVEAEKWSGWGTALKPAFEPIVVARKPLSGTVAETVLEWGTGGLNIDGSRICGEVPSVPQPSLRPNGQDSGHALGSGQGRNGEMSKAPSGRWPANVILDEYTADLLDQQSGVSKSTGGQRSLGAFRSGDIYGVGKDIREKGEPGFGDIGGASRFFYCAKASKRDRNEGLDNLPEQVGQRTHNGGEDTRGRPLPANRNTHPTVKPTALMRYLVKLVTPPGGTVLDPFMGSGSTGKAAVLEGFQFVGVELTEDYLPIIEGRLKWAIENQDEDTLF